MSSAPPDPAGRPSDFPRGHLPSQAGRGQRRCSSSENVSLPPNVELGGPRSRGERTHFPLLGRTPRLGSPAERSILTWGTLPTAALAVRTTRLSALTGAPPRPGAGPQLSLVDLSLSSPELARPHPPERVPAVRRATLASPEPALPSALRGHAYRPIRSGTSKPSPIRKCLGWGAWHRGTAPPTPLRVGSSARLVHVTAAAVAELGNWSGDARRGRVYSRGS